jgi:sugar phosphate isomerase/epimerase
VDTTEEERTAVRDAFAASGVALCCIATSCRFADPENNRDGRETAMKAIDLAGDLGCPRIRVFGGQIGGGLSREEAVDLVAESLGGLAEQAQARGVTVCMETHDDWCDPDHVAAVLKRVDHPNTAANWDIMHPVRRGGATMDQAFEALRPWIRHVHFHDGTVQEPLEMAPIGEGGIDHKRAVELLKKCDYDGYLSGEWIKWQPYEEHLPRELATMKRYEEELG